MDIDGVISNPPIITTHPLSLGSIEITMSKLTPGQEGGGRDGSKSAESIRKQMHSGQEAYSENQKSGRNDFELAVSLFNWILQRY